VLLKSKGNLICSIFFRLLLLYYQQSEGLQSIFKLMCGSDTVTWCGVHPAMSPQVSCKSKDQHLSLSIPVVCMIIAYVEVRQHNLFLKINNFILQITYYK
jgi:hypothetical protein